MKHLQITILWLSFSFAIEAQTTYNSYLSKETEAQKQQLVDAKNCFFKKQEDVSRLWKINVLDLLNRSYTFTNSTNGIYGGLAVGYEQKLSPSWSLNTAISGNISTTKLENSTDEDWQITTSNQEVWQITDYTSNIYLLALTVEPRWYYQKKKHIKRGESGNNLSGNYIGLQFKADVERHEYDQQWIPLSSDHTLPSIENLNNFSFQEQYNSYAFTINFGRQQQFIKNGFFDIKIGGGIQRRTINPEDQLFNGRRQSFQKKEATWSFPWNYELALGFTIDDHQLDQTTSNCDVFEYHTNDNYLLKLGIVNPRKLLAERAFSGSFTLGYEQKIKKSAFSVNVNMWNYVYHNWENENSDYQLSWEVEPRYYYNLKKRMVQGKTGNSFSANYIGLGSAFSFSDHRFIQLTPVLGIQRQFFKNILFDYKLGPGWSNSAGDKDFFFFSRLTIAIAYSRSFSKAKESIKKVFSVKRRKG